MPASIKICRDCGPLPVNHLENWIRDLSCLISGFLFGKIIPVKPSCLLEKIFFQFLIKLRLFRTTKNINYAKTYLRTKVFLDEIKKLGIECEQLLSLFGPANYFKLKLNNRIYFFEGLPGAEFLESKLSRAIDDKAKVKTVIQAADFPIAKGKSFLWLQKQIAVRWALKNLNFPLVVKPRFGSLSHHITVNIQNCEALKTAIARAIRYSPAFIIEEYIKNAFTYRATVINFDDVACVKRLPAHLIGDGRHTIKELIEIKNRDPRRGNPGQKNTILYKLVINETSDQLLKLQNHSYDSIPLNNELIRLQEKVILDLGADLHEETPLMHPDNQELFRKIAELFNTRLVGIDFLAKDISISWKNQPCAVIELNSLPYIDMHHFPTKGAPVNVAAAICKMVRKYY